MTNLQQYCASLQWPYLLLLTSVSYLANILRRWAMPDRIALWQGGLFLLGLCFFMVLLPWQIYEIRYLLVPEYCFACFIALELRQITSATNAKLAAIAILASLALVASARAIPAQIHRVHTLCYGEEAVSALRWFATSARPRTSVLVSEEQEEALRSTLSFLQRFFQRPDITVYSLSPLVEGFQREGFNAVRIDRLDDQILDKMDYVIWHRWGACRRKADERFKEMLKSELTPRSAEVRSIYEQMRTVDAPSRDVRGVQILELDHSKAP